MITSRKNEQLKIIRQAQRSKDGWALLEGPHLIAEALTSGYEPRSVLATPEFMDSAAARKLAPLLPFRPLAIDQGLLTEVTDSDSPRGIVAVMRLPRQQIEALSFGKSPVVVYADGLQDPGNLGALSRVAEATGAAALCLNRHTVHPNHPRALRASAGSLLRIPVAVNCSPEALGTRLEGKLPRWLGLATRGGQNLFEADFSGCLVLALGAEGRGLSPQVQANIDLELTIPTLPPVESLNATVAAAVALFEIFRRRGMP